ncbi:MAG: hypothetical protein JST64_11900, partial [Actinobacteria bacterium]|nr:hypothetical protein [Actinomycetota bacterium]
VPLWATVADGGTAIHDADLAGAGLLLVGSEAHGLPDGLLRAAHAHVSVPMEGAAESLNAAVAGAVVAFECARQRRSGSSTGPGGAAGEPSRGAPVGVRHDVSLSATPGAAVEAPTRQVQER